MTIKSVLLEQSGDFGVLVLLLLHDKLGAHVTLFIDGIVKRSESFPPDQLLRGLTANSTPVTIPDAIQNPAKAQGVINAWIEAGERMTGRQELRPADKVLTHEHNAA